MLEFDYLISGSAECLRELKGEQKAKHKRLKVNEFLCEILFAFVALWLPEEYKREVWELLVYACDQYREESGARASFVWTLVALAQDTVYVVKHMGVVVEMIAV